jgi:hypothetical protein
MHRISAFLLTLCLLVSVSSLSALAQETFVIVPDNPGGGSGAGNAVATSNVNVRRGPGTSYAVVDVLRSGQSVRISNCNGGWCWVNHGGPSGWVSQNFLTRTGGGGGDNARRRACFYDDIRFRGRSFCVGVGDSNRDLGSWNNRIASISISGSMTVEVCEDRGFRNCEDFNRDVAILPWWLDGNISSFRTFR